MGYNKKKTAKLNYEHQDKMLDDQRKKRGLDKEKTGPYDRILGETRKNEEILSTVEKQLQKHHKESDKTKKLTEKWFDDESKRDDSTHKTNTLPINELAEEAQRRRMALRGDGDGFVKDHFQDHKKESVGLSEQNYGKLSKVMDEMDKLWMASSWSRLTTSEKKKITALKKERDAIALASIKVIDLDPNDDSCLTTNRK